MKQDDCYQLGNVIKAHGLNGEIQVFLDVDVPEEYEELESFFVLTGKKLIPFFIETFQLNGNKALIKLEGVEDRAAAEDLSGAGVFLPLAALPELNDDQFYYHEIVGFEFYHQNQLLGTVENVVTFSAQTLLTIKVDEQEVLVPLQDEIILSVDKEKQRIDGQLPDGLLEIYLDNDTDHEN